MALGSASTRLRRDGVGEPARELRRTGRRRARPRSGPRRGTACAWRRGRGGLCWHAAHLAVRRRHRVPRLRRGLADAVRRDDVPRPHASPSPCRSRDDFGLVSAPCRASWDAVPGTECLTPCTSPRATSTAGNVDRIKRSRLMSDFVPGLEGVVAFETEIAEPDKEGGALRYRGRRHRGPGRPRLLRQRVGPAGRRRLQPRSAARRAVPDPRALRRHPRRRAVGAGHARPGVGAEAAARHRRRAGPRRPRPRRRDGAVVRRPVGARPGAADGAAAGDRQGAVRRRAVHDPLARRARPEARRRRRRLLDLGRRARHERVHLHRPRHRLHRRRRRRRPVRRGRRHVRPAARRRALPRPRHDRGDRADRRRRGVREAGPGQGRAPDGLRPPRLPRRGPARAGAAPYRPGAGRAALRGRGGAGEGGAGGAARPPPGPGPGDERGVLGGDHAGLRRGPGAHVHVDVHLRPHGRAGRRTSWSRSARGAWCAPRPATSARGPATRARSTATRTSHARACTLGA